MSPQAISITKVDFAPELVTNTSPLRKHDQEKALADLLEQNHLLCEAHTGPYQLYVAQQENKLLVTISNSSPVSEHVQHMVLPLTKFRRLVKDYTIICENYQHAVATSDPSKVQAIDMGRRSLHNEGAEMVQKYLPEGVEVDYETSRRLFSLFAAVCR